MSTQDAPRDFNEKLAGFLFIFLSLLVISVPILSQSHEYNQYLNLLYLIIKISIAVVIISLSISLLNVEFTKETVRQQIVAFLLLVFIYYYFASFVSLGVHGTISSFYSENVSEIYPEYGTYLIPAFSLSILFVYRLFDFFIRKDNLKDLQISLLSGASFKISFTQVRNPLKGIIIGVLFLSLLSIFLSDIRISTISTNMIEFHLFALISSFIVASLEEVIHFISLNLRPIKLYDEDLQPAEAEKQKPSKINEFVDKHKTVSIFLGVGAVVLVAFMVSTVNFPDEQCCNTTVLEISVEEIDSTAKKTFVNDTYALIPLVTINDQEKPLTERTEHLVSNKLVTFDYSERSLVVSTKKTTIPLLLVTNQDFASSSNEAVDMSKVLNSFPADYDISVIYSLYKNGHEKFYAAGLFQDSGTMVNAEKFFFAIDTNKSNVAIFINGGGTTFVRHPSKIHIVSLNETFSAGLVNLLEFERKENEIEVIGDDPLLLPLFNCSINQSGSTYNNLEDYNG